MNPSLSETDPRGVFRSSCVMSGKKALSFIVPAQNVACPTGSREVTPLTPEPLRGWMKGNAYRRRQGVATHVGERQRTSSWPGDHVLAGFERGTNLSHPRVRQVGENED